MGRYNILVLSDSDLWISTYVQEFADVLRNDEHIVAVKEEFSQPDKFDFCFMFIYSKLISREQLSLCGGIYVGAKYKIVLDITVCLMWRL